MRSKTERREPDAFETFIPILEIILFIMLLAQTGMIIVGIYTVFW